MLGYPSVTSRTSLSVPTLKTDRGRPHPLARYCRMRDNVVTAETQAAMRGTDTAWAQTAAELLD